jgi:hypothetical protein
MNEQQVRDQAQAVCDALVAGDVDQVVASFSEQLRSNAGTTIALLPLPLTEASVESVEPGGKGYVVTLRLVGESDEVRLETRWKERDGEPTIVEASHTAAPTPPAAPAEAEQSPEQ